MPKRSTDPGYIQRQLERQQDQAARLQRLRRALNITQTKAATVVGVSLFKWHRMEHGQHPIDPLALQLFCEAFDLGSDYVICAIDTVLPPRVRDRVLKMEAEELQQADRGLLNEREAPDIQRRLAAQRHAETPACPNPPDATGRRKRRSEQLLPV